MIPHNKVSFTPEAIQAATEALASGQVAPGGMCHSTEVKWAELVGAEDAVMVGSGFAALRLSLVALHAGCGDYPVGIPAYSCVCLANAVSDVAGYVVEDIGPDLNLAQPSQVLGTVVAVHTFGAHCDMTRFQAATIEDMSHGIFQQTADLAVASFGPTKYIGSIGGGIVSGSCELVESVRGMRDYGDKPVSGVRQNDAPNEVAASIVLEQLGRLDAIREDRGTAAINYECLLMAHGLAWATPPPAPYRYTVRVPDAAATVEAMAALGIRCEQPVWDWLGPQDALPQTTRAHREVMSLPFWVGITHDDQARVVRALAGVLRGGNVA